MKKYVVRLKWNVEHGKYIDKTNVANSIPIVDRRKAIYDENEIINSLHNIEKYLQVKMTLMDIWRTPIINPEKIAYFEDTDYVTETSPSKTYVVEIETDKSIDVLSRELNMNVFTDSLDAIVLKGPDFKTEEVISNFYLYSLTFYTNYIKEIE